MRTVLIGAGSIGGTVATLAYEGGYKIDVVVNSEEKAEKLRQGRSFFCACQLGRHGCISAQCLLR